jgi:uncharacterized protein
MGIRVTEINIYPVKGLGGISCSTSIMQARGLKHDRRFMLVDDDSQFLSQRELPQMATIQTAIEGDKLIFRATFGDEISVPLTPPPQPTRRVQVWSSTVDAHAVSSEADAWFAEQLGSNAHLVYMPDSSIRACNPQYATNHEIVSFADGYPVLITNEASLTDLNTRITVTGGNAVPMNRFRANIVVQGATAWAEDNWRDIQIGSATFRAVKSCARCQVTTTDQATGEVKGPEPLKTLSTFRDSANGILFGVNLVPVIAGTINVGDVVEVAQQAA